jgi:membrane protease YdiL (CAAX protease family)
LTANEIVVTEKRPCIKCETLIDLNCRFCNTCGTRQAVIDENGFDNKWLLLKQAAIFYAIHILSCVLLKFVHFFDTAFWSWFFEITLWICNICFFAINWAANKKLLVWRNFSWQKLAAYGAIAMTGSFIVHYSMGWVNIVIFSKDEYYLFLKGNVYAEVIAILLTAVTPALFEEIGFRGYLLGSLLKVSDTQQAIFISAFLFAIIHLSFISLVWLLPFALFIGYVRVKENTLWYGIFFHFCFNLTACLFELL